MAKSRNKCKYFKKTGVKHLKIRKKSTFLKEQNQLKECLK